MELTQGLVVTEVKRPAFRGRDSKELLYQGNHVHDGNSNLTRKQALSVISQPPGEVFNQCYSEKH